MRERSWWSLIAVLAVTTIASRYVIDAIVPSSLWFDVRSVEVSNSVQGESPRMSVDRDIKLPFPGTWKAEVEEKVGSDAFLLVQGCENGGSNNYSPSNRLPPNLNLQWWLAGIDCDLEPGEYRVETVWTIYPDYWSPRSVRTLSNTFTITE